jgi:hypothetical protein
MARVKGPLFSNAASGDFAKTIQFVCGHFVRQKPKVNDPKTLEQSRQREKFLEGAEVWLTELSEHNKTQWHLFKEVVSTKDACIKAKMYMTGYNCWMLYWLRFGRDGWPNYPQPPF